ncbi:pyridoxal kinase [Fulvimarina sp. 2208YS6-2-32]|uniref:pyridoxal kinase n=1 Tax=Fulvimarina uroteuthidis TaxID=3098149 RepID=A0ABU5I1J1_9HYPH|nr:pyridoxal kinase [Fulvimarina sp. 2208YS6-2-32]MDY8109002.1 pyridoxal kinase [Fulvimarina sp. 2208YS6-2-32]
MKSIFDQRRERGGGTREAGPDRATVLSISSHVVRGAVGNRAVVFALESLGHQVWSVPTITLPWHPGHGAGTQIVPDDTAFEAVCRDLAGSPFALEIEAVITGYFASKAQVEASAGLIAALRRTNPDLVYCLDPVLGDEGRLYRPPEVLAAIRESLMPLANLATPNRFELEFLTGLGAHDNGDLIDAARTLGCPQVLVTSAFAMLSGSIGNLLVGERSAELAEHRLIANGPNGGGDLTAALYLARLLEGQSPEKALRLATASVFEIVARTARTGHNEMALQKEAASLSHPMAMVQMRTLAGAKKR